VSIFIAVGIRAKSEGGLKELHQSWNDTFLSRAINDYLNNALKLIDLGRLGSSDAHRPALMGSLIRIFGLRPGTVATEMQAEIKASGINSVSQLDHNASIPPEWVARASAWLAGP
jgi:hypothetical protein